MILFAFFGFWGSLAVGIGAVSIPVIIHLINRRRYKIVPWAAMKFLLAAQKQTRKRMRIEQLLLLLVRMMILGFVCLAMASVMPWAEDVWAAMGLNKLGKGKAGRDFRVHHIFVLDASLSMNQKVGEQTAFEIARQQALKKIQDNPSHDGYSVLLLKDNPTWLVGEGSHYVRKVSEEIRNAKPSHGNASLPAALNMIVAKLNEIEPRFKGGAQAVYFFTDMQQANWLDAVPHDKTDADGKDKHPFFAIQDKAATIFVDCGPEKASPNLAVTDLEFDSSQPYLTPGTDLTLFATIRNYGPDTAKARAELLIGKAKEGPGDPPLQMRVNDQETREVPGRGQMGGQTEIVFKKVKFPGPGTYAVQVRIGSDALDQDNARTIVITVRDTIPVLLVNGKTSADRFELATEYLRLTLNPFGAAAPSWLPLRPEVVAPSEFSRKTEADLEKYDCIFWADVGQFTANDVRKLDVHLRRGGGFIVSLGEEAVKHLDVYNDLLHKNEQGLLPAKLMKRIDAPKDHHFYFSNSDNTAYMIDPLKAFEAEQDRAALRTAHFRKFVQAVVPEGKARTVLYYGLEVENEKAKREDALPVGAPALVEWNPPLGRAQQPAPKAGQRGERTAARYRGKVILLTSTLNMDWNNWPGSPSYGAMMHELTRLGVSGRLREQSQPVGGVLEAFLPGGAEIKVPVHFPPEIEGHPAGKAHSQLIDDVNLVRFADTDFSGIYRFETPRGEVPFAVNVPSVTPNQSGSESDLTRVDETKFRDMNPDWKIQIVRDARRAQLSGAPMSELEQDVRLPFGPDLANGLLLMVLGLLFLEIVLAWKFGHYTTTEGALSNAPPGSTSTVVAAAIAVASTFLFAVGAIIVAHEFYTGDFLGFMPEMLRTWFENRIGAQDRLADEGSRWNLHKFHYLFSLPGDITWYSVFFTIAAIATIFFAYKAEAPRVPRVYKFLLGALRLYVILFAIWFLLPRPELHYDREGFPDLVLLIDDTRSMGEPDSFQNPKVIERVKKLSESIQEQLRTDLPARLTALEAEIDAKRPKANDPDVKADLDGLMLRHAYVDRQIKTLAAGTWRPSRLQLVQAILSQKEPHWLKTLMEKKFKVHVFHLDAEGRAIKLTDGKDDIGELVDRGNIKAIERAVKGIRDLDPRGNDSRLGESVKRVIDHYRGSGLASVIMFTDGITTRDETLSQAGDYAHSKGVPLLFVGVGDEHDKHDLQLHDLSVADQIYLGDNAVFKIDLTAKGYQSLDLPLLFQLIDENGKEITLKEQKIKIEPQGKKATIKITLSHQPKKLGRHRFRIEIKPPKLEANERPIPQSQLRVERTIEVIDTKQIKVLYVEGQPRYEFRYIKFLLEREAPDEKDAKQKKKSIDLKVVLLDADEDWHVLDKTALATFPPTLEELQQYDVLIFGDCDVNHVKLRNRLKDIKAFVQGVDENGKKTAKKGAGVLFIAGALHNPHHYKGTPLADILPVEPISKEMPREELRKDRYHPVLTSMARGHPIFQFSPSDLESQLIFERLTKIYWNSSGYGIKPLANVLAVHPELPAVGNTNNQVKTLPLIVEHRPGDGRALFFGFDESWRWRWREDEPKYNTFWIQTMRFLARGDATTTRVTLNKQTPYRVGEKIEITVDFPPHGAAGPKEFKLDEKTEVKVTIHYQPPGGKESDLPSAITLAKVPGSSGTYKGTFDQTREGKYTIRLTNPDVSAAQPDGKKPSVEAVVEMPPGELDKQQMDVAEMSKAAARSNGEFFTLANADELLDRVPPGIPISMASNAQPTLLWNQWWAFALVVFLMTGEWILRKMKHLL